MSTKLFTLHEANELLPQLKEELHSLQALTQQFEDQYVALKKAKSERKREAAPGGQEEDEDPFFESESRLEFLKMEIELAIQNFTRQGVLLKMISPGLLDFPAELNGESVLICWKEGEERATHYHGWHDGFTGRKPHPEA